MGVLTVKGVRHYPRLDTVIMVEEAIKKYSGECTRTELWSRLERKMMYQTFKIVVDYLLKSKKIVIKGGKVIWIFNPDLMERLMDNSVEV